MAQQATGEQQEKEQMKPLVHVKDENVCNFLIKLSGMLALSRSLNESQRNVSKASIELQGLRRRASQLEESVKGNTVSTPLLCIQL
jgi:hypothetical protein